MWQRLYWEGFILSKNKLEMEIDAFLKQSFKKCRFTVQETRYDVRDSVVYIMLREGPFDAFEKGYGSAEITMAKMKTMYSRVEELNCMPTPLSAGKVLSSEVKKVFSDICRFIKGNYSGEEYSDHLFSFSVSLYTNKAEGTIPKPTEIDRKVFKGRSRRKGVSERVMIRIDEYPNTERKDVDRIKDIVDRSKGDPRSIVNRSYNMAKAITKVDKADRRASACWGLYTDYVYHTNMGLSKAEIDALGLSRDIFFDRSLFLGGESPNDLLPKSHYLNLIPQMPGVIPKPTEVEYKTAKRPKRRGVVESVLGQIGKLSSSLTKEVSKVEGFLKSHFKECSFQVLSYEDTIFIYLTQGDFPPLEGGLVGTGVNIVTSKDAKDRGLYSVASKMDPNVVKAINKRETLSEEATFLFQSVVKYIRRNFGSQDNDHILWFFCIDGSYRFVKGSKQGDISKPTKVEHQMFKGRKRRSVAEDILDTEVF